MTNLRRTLATIAAIAVVGSAVTMVSAPAQAADTAKAPSIQAAATSLKAPLFAPTFTVGLPQQGKVTVTTDTAAGGSASVEATWAKGKRTFSTLQNPDFVAPVLDSEPNIAYGEVGKDFTITVRSGERFTVGIDALCGTATPSADGNIPEFTCSRKDVKAFGGSLMMTLVTKQANAATIMITSGKGISYAQLVRIAKGMAKVQP